MKVELLTNLRHQASNIVLDLQRSKEPVLITDQDQPVAYLVDVQEFDLMQRRMMILDGLLRGERAVIEGRTLSHAEARGKMGRWL